MPWHCSLGGWGATQGHYIGNSDGLATCQKEAGILGRAGSWPARTGSSSAGRQISSATAGAPERSPDSLLGKGFRVRHFMPLSRALVYLSTLLAVRWLLSSESGSFLSVALSHALRHTAIELQSLPEHVREFSISRAYLSLLRFFADDARLMAMSADEIRGASEETSVCGERRMSPS